MNLRQYVKSRSKFILTPFQDFALKYCFLSTGLEIHLPENSQCCPFLYWVVNLLMAACMVLCARYVTKVVLTAQ